MPETPQTPPSETNYDGQPRQVGVEIEFAALSAEDAALIVKDIFGGEISIVDAHCHRIEGTRFGDFESELDFQYIHRSKGAAKPDENDDLGRLLENFQHELRTMLGKASALLVPCEIVCPPVPVKDLSRIDQLLAALSAAGAQGTGENPLYAFGAQLNPDIASRRADYIVSMLKAYLLSSDWLRAQIAVDVTRRIFAFADPFPLDYALLVTDSGYRPGMDQLIDDYLAYNPTRNRELDMLPLFAWLDEDRVFASIQDARIKKRPTFHYRLPDSRFGDRTWTIVREWNRWCAVERLADDRERLDGMALAFEENKSRFLGDDWGVRAREWIGAP